MEMTIGETRNKSSSLLLMIVVIVRLLHKLVPQDSHLLKGDPEVALATALSPVPVYSLSTHMLEFLSSVPEDDSST